MSDRTDALVRNNRAGTSQRLDPSGSPGRAAHADSPAQPEPVEHVLARDRLRAQYAAIPAGERVRLAKRTSNLFRPRETLATPGLDVSGLNRVLSIDPVGRTADVQAMTTFEDLVDAALAHRLMPLVVPQLKTITIGGAVTGLGIESTSFRDGLPHESVREIEILLGDGRIVTATPDGECADLFRAFPNSYGTLGYALRLTIELAPVHPYVALRHVRFRDLEEITAAIDEVMTTREYEGAPVDFVDGVVFARDESYLCLGTWADLVPRTSDYTGREIYYRSIRSKTSDFLTVRDYLWRWDTDWFWCSRAFGAQNPYLRRVWPRRLLRSDVYWKLIALDNRYAVADRLNRWRGRPARERVVQDVELPVAHTAEFLNWFLREVPIEPIWLCPIQLRDNASGRHPWPLYPLEPRVHYVNVGFWSTVPIAPGAVEGATNRAIEAEVARLNGHKSLYSDAYYSRDEFARLYGGDAYAAAKSTYDPQRRLADLYDKAVMRR
jgi:FAD/FMN-containing dehydrogenase